MLCKIVAAVRHESDQCAFGETRSDIPHRVALAQAYSCRGPDDFPEA
jgi:hypothetical protein